MEYLAHSARGGAPPQAYEGHVQNVVRMASANAEAAAEYAACDGQLLRQLSPLIAEYHDLGKLDPDNQAVLHQEGSKGSLPVNHVDAGTAHLKDGLGVIPAALAVYSHHCGLPDVMAEKVRKNVCFRDDNPAIRERTDGELEDLLSVHSSLRGTQPVPETSAPRGDGSVFYRMLLSCLADADHTDTALHYRQVGGGTPQTALRAEERLRQMDQRMSEKQGTGLRNELRRELYRECRDMETGVNITACDAPVGSGKTTAVMAHLLRQAAKRGLRRIFVVLPFTNIITQSVEIYRELLTLPGENPEEVVAELHHRADYESVDARALSAQWRAPVIVTTAVSFFETLASNRPSTLRRLHELPGSAVFVDESHSALPLRLLPLAWHWMQVLADEWSCYWVLTSGSLVRFWELEEIAPVLRDVPNLTAPELRERLKEFERRRIRYEYLPKPLERVQLARRVLESPGPRLLIVNTVQSAAVMARELSMLCGQSEDIPLEKRKVLHLSSALCPEDRKTMVDLVRSRMNAKDADSDWVLVATSCVEAGVDFSFHTGFREKASLLSLLQSAGRVNRGDEYGDAVMWSFSMQDDALLSANPAFQDSSYVLTRMLERGIPVAPERSTQSVRNELNRGGTPELVKTLRKAEKSRNFREVAKAFHVIEGDTVLVIADTELAQSIREGKLDWTALQRKGIPIRRKRAEKLGLPVLTENICEWNRRYDSFLGIMAGSLEYGTGDDLTA